MRSRLKTSRPPEAQGSVCLGSNVRTTRYGALDPKQVPASGQAPMHTYIIIIDLIKYQLGTTYQGVTGAWLVFQRVD